MSTHHWPSAPSGKAKAAAHERIGVSARTRMTARGIADDVLAAAHDPSLGSDRSVCLRDVVERLRERNAGGFAFYGAAADFIEREFTGGNRG